MKRAIVAVIFCATVVGGVWWGERSPLGKPGEGRGRHDDQVAVRELVDARVAQALKGMEPVSDKTILRGDNWHTAIYDEVKYTIYTGPGVVVLGLPVQRGPKATPPRSGMAPKSSPSRPAAH